MTLPVCLIAYVFQAECAPPLFCASCKWDSFVLLRGEERGARAWRAAARENRVEAGAGSWWRHTTLN